MNCALRLHLLANLETAESALAEAISDLHRQRATASQERYRILVRKVDRARALLQAARLEFETRVSNHNCGDRSMEPRERL